VRDELTPSAVYHIDFDGRVPRGQVLHVEDHPGGQADIYVHPLHIREPAVWDLNWATRHMVGMEFWRQHWTHEGRMQEPAEGLNLAEAVWKIVPASSMPAGRYAFCLETRGRSIWLIRSGYCTAALRDAHNEMCRRLAGDGLWVQDWHNDGPPRPRTPLPALSAPRS